MALLREYFAIRIQSRLRSVTKKRKYLASLDLTKTHDAVIARRLRKDIEDHVYFLCQYGECIDLMDENLKQKNNLGG